MKQREVRKFLKDVQSALTLLQQFTAEKNFDEYQRDRLLQSAVERQLEIIGEAIGQAIRLDPALESKISHAKRIIGLRNRLIHAYADISGELIWGVLELHLPRLNLEIDDLLESDDEGR